MRAKAQMGPAEKRGEAARLTRTCMVCGAKPNQKCFRIIKQGGYARSLLRSHPER